MGSPPQIGMLVRKINHQQAILFAKILEAAHQWLTLLTSIWILGGLTEPCLIVKTKYNVKIVKHYWALTLVLGRCGDGGEESRAGHTLHSDSCKINCKTLGQLGPPLGSLNNHLPDLSRFFHSRLVSKLSSAADD